MRIFHGTSYENGLSILKNGWNTNKSNWNCSAPEHIYWAYDKNEDEEKNAFRLAIEAGQISAVLSQSNSESIFIFFCDIDEKDKEEWIETYADRSCPNMDTCALEIPLETVKKLSIQSKELKESFLPSLRLAYLAGCSTKYLNIDVLTEQEQQVLNNPYLNQAMQNLWEQIMDA